MGERDEEAIGLVGTRAFDRAAIVDLRIEMATRRVTLVVYGPLQRGSSATHLGTLTFFGTRGFTLASDDAANDGFPRSAQLAQARVAYDADEDGVAEFTGRAGWRIAFAFDGVSYAEHPAVIASLVDETEDDS